MRRRDVVARLARFALLIVAWLGLSAHVGSNETVFESAAGPYRLRVVVRPPGVIPAQVPILVRVLEGDVTALRVRAAHWRTGTQGAPPAEAMRPVPGEAGTWAHDLWIMTGSVYAVHVDVEGAGGAASLLVPVQMEATRTLAMTRGMGAILLALGALLVAGMLAIAGAAARESALPAGASPDGVRRRRGRFASAVAAAVLALALFGGSRWWRAEEAAYRRRLARSLAVETTVRAVDGDRVLALAVTDSLWFRQEMPPLEPDHGRIMHMFLARLPDLDVVAHVHPVRETPDRFVSRLPALPGGRYLVFADVVHDMGFARTFTDTTIVPEGAVSAGRAGETRRSAAADSALGIPAADPDDAWAMLAEASGTTRLADGATITLALDAAPVAGRDVRLDVIVREADGSPTVLEPYLGMAGHAFVLRRDGAVFMHLHPSGTVSMVAQQALARRERGDTLAAAPAAGDAHGGHDAHAMHGMSPDGAATGAAPGDAAPPSVAGRPGADGRVGFPFSVASPGDYRLLVQVRRAGRIETAALDVRVASAVGAADGP